MNARTSHRDDVAVVHLSGALHHGDEDSELRKVFETLIAGGERQIVLDLGRVTSMDSSGLGELIRARATAARVGAELRLASVPPRVLQLLEVAQLIPVFDLFDDVDAAVDAVATP